MTKLIHTFKKRKPEEIDYLDDHQKSREYKSGSENSNEVYRRFRASHFPSPQREKYRSTTDSDYLTLNDSCDSVRLTELRMAIRQYRENISNAALADITFARTNKIFLARALSLPEILVSSPVWIARLAKIIGLLLPTTAQTNFAKEILGKGKTYESREFLFRRYFVLFDSWGSYSESLDYALMKIPPSNSLSFTDLKRIDIHWVRLAHQLGIKNWSELDLALKGQDRFRSGRFEELLVNQGVIKSISELAWLLLRPKDRHFNRPPQDIDWNAAVELMNQLINHDVSRELITKVLIGTPYDFNAIQLSEKFDLLKRNSINKDEVFSQLGPLFWKISHEKLEFLINDLGFTSPAHLVAFKDFLNCNTDLDEQTLLHYREFGAAPEDFIQAKKLLVKVSQMQPNCHSVAAMELLMNEPYRFTINQLAYCENYILSKGQLSDYLKLLATYGLTSTDDILCFQAAFSHIHAKSVEHLFSLAIPRCVGSDKKLICRWIVDATRSGYTDVFEYLILKLNAQSLPELESVLRFSRVNLTILKYAVEEQGLLTLKKLSQWYYHNAIGIHDIHLPPSLSPVDRLLLESAFTTHRFSALQKNREVINTEITRRVGPKTRTAIIDQQGNVSQEHLRERAELEQVERIEIAIHLPEILNATGGILLPSILKDVGESEWNLSDRIMQLEPVAKSLLSGKGPIHSDLLPLEEEAIALVYCIPAGRIRSHWCDLTTHVPSWGFSCFDSTFHMEWKRKELTLTRPLDKNGFKVLTEAVVFAQHFNKFYRTDIDSACLHLSPKRLKEPARDISTLSKHLGLLLAISGVLDRACWSVDFFRSLAAIENHVSYYDQVAQLSNLFSIELRDAVLENVDAFLFGLSPTNRKFLASRIVTEHHSFGEQNERLHRIIAFMLDVVTDKYLTWSELERSKFRPEASERSRSKMYSVISKFPASFFAPIAVGICTGGDIALWKEDRLSLFLIFDDKEKRFAGMVYLFTHMLITDCGERSILVARAFNLMPDYLAGFDAASIVDSIIFALIDFAKRNGFSAFALPEDSGQHLLSNNVELERAIKQRMDKAKPCYGPLSLKEQPDVFRPICVKTNFDAYSEGRETVDHIYIMWKDYVSDNSLSTSK